MIDPIIGFLFLTLVYVFFAGMLIDFIRDKWESDMFKVMNIVSIICLVIVTFMYARIVYLWVYIPMFTER